MIGFSYKRTNQPKTNKKYTRAQLKNLVYIDTDGKVVNIKTEQMADEVDI